MQRGFTGGGQVREDVTPLLLERGDHGQHALDEATAVLAVGAEADLPPDDRAAEGAFSGVV